MNVIGDSGKVIIIFSNTDYGTSNIAKIEHLIDSGYKVVFVNPEKSEYKSSKMVMSKDSFSFREMFERSTTNGKLFIIEKVNTLIDSLSRKHDVSSNFIAQLIGYFSSSNMKVITNYPSLITELLNLRIRSGYEIYFEYTADYDKHYTKQDHLSEHKVHLCDGVVSYSYEVLIQKELSNEKLIFLDNESDGNANFLMFLEKNGVFNNKNEVLASALKNLSLDDNKTENRLKCIETMVALHGKLDSGVQISDDVVRNNPIRTIILSLKLSDFELLRRAIKEVDGLKGISDMGFWENKGEDFLQVYALRKAKEYGKALRIAESLLIEDSDIREEIGNVLYELGEIGDSSREYFSVIEIHEKLHTLDGAYNFYRIAMNLKKEKVANHILIPFQEYNSKLLKDFLTSFNQRKNNECVSLGREYLKYPLIDNELNADVHAIMGLCYERMKNGTKALEEAKYALRYKANHEEAIGLLTRNFVKK